MAVTVACSGNAYPQQGTETNVKVDEEMNSAKYTSIQKEKPVKDCKKVESKVKIYLSEGK